MQNVLAVHEGTSASYDRMIKKLFKISGGDPNSTQVKLYGAHNWICAMNHDLGGQSVATFGEATDVDSE